MGLRDDDGEIHTDLSIGYNSSGYSDMDGDRWRNAYFQASLQSASGTRPAPPTTTTTTTPPRHSRSSRRKKEGTSGGSGGVFPPSVACYDGDKPPMSSWLEIGPGAVGTLTRMALEASPKNEVFAIEAVKESAEGVARQLKGYGERFQVSHDDEFCFVVFSSFCNGKEKMPLGTDGIIIAASFFFLRKFSF